jgi:hypothetical protein
MNPNCLSQWAPEGVAIHSSFFILGSDAYAYAYAQMMDWPSTQFYYIHTQSSQMYTEGAYTNYYSNI